MREIIVNLKDTILTYAAAINHTHDGYISRSELDTHEQKNAQTEMGHTQLDNNITSTTNNPVAGKTIYNWVTTQLSNYTNTSGLSDLLRNYYNKTQIDNLLAEINTKLGKVTTDWSGHSITNPKKTTTKINNLINPGYYLFTGDGTFSCSPDTVSYKNGLIRVEKQSNHIIQHVYSTSYSSSSQKYKIDGRIFVRHGYTTTESNGTVKPHWDPWSVSHLPWRERKDLVKSIHSSVDNFKIYECTAGYVFQWKQNGSREAFVLPMNKYDYINVCTFKKTLPIVSGYVVGNLIGHLDIRVTTESFKARSINNKGETIIGVDVSYFVPRKN